MYIANVFLLRLQNLLVCTGVKNEMPEKESSAKVQMNIFCGGHYRDISIRSNWMGKFIYW